MAQVYVQIAKVRIALRRLWYNLNVSLATLDREKNGCRELVRRRNYDRRTPEKALA